MRRVIAIAVLCAVAACGAQRKAERAPNLADSLSPGCYTVDLFDPYRLEYPSADVPAGYREFLGVWQNGAWGGQWCHDLYITKVHADGRVELLDVYGPSPKHGHEASVFKRTGQIEGGVLTFLSHRRAPVSYRIVGDFLVGNRSDHVGKSEITMSRTDRVAQVPVPPRKPIS